MSANYPFSLRIFVADGDPDGLRIVERSNWIGKALMFPRTIFPSIKQRNEFAQTGVYLLLGPRDDGDGEQIYIGEGDPVKPRLESHYASKDFWNRAVFFTSTGSTLNKAHVQFLEARLITLASEAKRSPLDNKNQPAESHLSEADRADMDVFLEHLLGMLPVLGIYAFEQPKRTTKNSQPETLYLDSKGMQARGYESSQGFIVLNGSQAMLKEQPSAATHARGAVELRADLKERGVIKEEGNELIFTQDFSFSSPSTAASVILGRAANGRTEWKDKQGKALKAIQEEDAK
ncbi:MAG: GIY-YIG nuclease family protein [Gallionella sp.]|jgi:hypothetical protein